MPSPARARCLPLRPRLARSDRPCAKESILASPLESMGWHRLPARKDRSSLIPKNARISLAQDLIETRFDVLRFDALVLQPHRVFDRFTASSFERTRTVAYGGFKGSVWNQRIDKRAVERFGDTPEGC